MYAFKIIIICVATINSIAVPTLPVVNKVVCHCYIIFNTNSCRNKLSMNQHHPPHPPALYHLSTARKNFSLKHFNNQLYMMMTEQTLNLSKGHWI